MIWMTTSRFDMNNTDTKADLPDHWMPVELLGAPGAFQRAAREYAEAYASLAMAADRKRWAAAFESMRDKALKAQSGAAGDLVNVMLRQLAYLGFGECAAAIGKQGPNTRLTGPQRPAQE